MYGSPTFNEMVRGNSMDNTTPNIYKLCNRLTNHIYTFGGTPTTLQKVSIEMSLPESNVVNLSVELYASGLLFLAAMDDLRRGGLLKKGFTSDDISAANAFRADLVEKLAELSTGRADKRTASFYRRDIVPLVGTTAKSQLLYRE